MTLSETYAAKDPPFCWRCSLDYRWCRCIGTDEWLAEREAAFNKALRTPECRKCNPLPLMLEANWPEIVAERFLNKIARERLGGETP